MPAHKREIGPRARIECSPCSRIECSPSYDACPVVQTAARELEAVRAATFSLSGGR